MKRLLICEANLVCIPFHVYACEYGGSFDCGAREIEIGLSRNSFEYSLSVLLHEACECSFALKDMRFANPSHFTAHDSFVFQFNHHQFSDAMHEASMFVAQVIDPLRKAVKDWNRKIRK